MSENRKNLKFDIKLSGYRESEHANRVGTILSEIIKSLSNSINMSALEGVSVGYDYHKELNLVDRGIENSNPLKPSDGDVVGVAMVVRVIREATPRAHIVFNAAHLEGFIDDIESDSFQRSLAIVSHECAHVSNMSALCECYPGRMMHYRYKNIHESLRGECWLSVMEEYCASRIAAGIDANQSADFKKYYIKQTHKLNSSVRNYIEDYRSHGNVDRVLNEVYKEIDLTLKLAGYYFGDKAGNGDEAFNPSDIEHSGEWIIPFYNRLNSALIKIFERYGAWEDISEMEVISDILDDIARHLGMHVSITPQGVYVHIP
ncbi:hypothetical protein C7425_104254 [Pantoea ananatis]|uniref:hypothetical protein n=1 Tax=Pantoea ananas TaxID=553 RepID=UPI000D6DA31D|nr:hypothetical protein [Pantoea ananatis]PWK09870.1 hypothetical protein C7421_103185 [Pantoea ananatis]PWV66528.1 hypothetical protein C7425_104254 [Pantoea ananatis]